MNLLALLTALAAEAWMEALPQWRRRLPVAAAAQTVRRLLGGLPSPTLVALLTVAPLPLAVGLAQWLLGGLLWGLWGLALAAVVLALSLGPESLGHEVDALLEAAESGDGAAAAERTAALTDAAGTETAADAVLVEAERRLFAPIFWLLILGPVGAALYRSAWWVARGPAAGDDGEAGEAAGRLLWLLDWVPARLAALGYALAGSFEESAEGWRCLVRRAEDPHRASAEELLVCTGRGALGLLDDEGETVADASPDAVREARTLVRRALAVWVTAVALLTLGGWVA